MTKLTADGIISSYTYDPNGNLTKKALNNGFTTEYAYNDANLLTKMANKKGSSVYQDFYCEYFVNGAKYCEGQLNRTDYSKYYTYDGLGRVKTESVVQGINNIRGNAYTYDSYGNRTREVITDCMNNNRTFKDYAYDANNRLLSVDEAYAESDTAPSGNSTGRARYYYDKNGNMTGEQKMSYTNGNESTNMLLSGRFSGNSLKLYKYDAFNQLIQYSDGATQAEYRYNANGLRASKTVNGAKTDFVWNGQNLAAETTNGIANTYSYDVTGIHSASINGAVQTYIKDTHGSVIGLAGKNGAKLDTKYDYDAFGNQLYDEPNPFGYCGEYYDSESGNIYLRARYYDSNIGRFISEDPVKDGMNWYIYGANNPIRFTDPSGQKIRIKKNQEQILGYLNELSRDTLAVDENGYVYIEEWNPDANDRSVGTELVYQLITNKNICDITLTNYFKSSGTKYSNERDSKVQGKGSDTTVKLSTNDEYAETEGSDDLQVTPMYIKLGHELIHSLRAMKGNRKDRNLEGVGFTPKGRKLEMPREEFETSGISYREKNGNEWQNQAWVNTESWYFTEKSLREEHGLSRRVS